jgi:YjbE family integral membrane protein
MDAILPVFPPHMGHITPGFFFDAFSIVLIDILLGGDNAVVIAMAVKSLPEKERRIGIMAGAGAAVVLRIVFTFFAAQLLELNYIKFSGGFLILWIAIRLLTEGEEDPELRRGGRSLWQAMWLILVADLTMSIDNILAVAASSRGNVVLLIFGLGLSIPFVVFTSSLLSRIMDRFPILIYLGAAILGRVGGEMMVTDPWIKGLVHPSHALEIGVQVFCVVAVLVAGKLLAKCTK